MLKRTISGAVYIAILAVFFVLRQLVCEHSFYILLAFLCTYGSFEVARAVKDLSHKSIVPLCLVIGALFVPLYFGLRLIFDSYLTSFVGKEYVYCLILLLVGIFAWVVITIVKKLDMSQLKWGILAVLYPCLLMTAMLVAQSMGKDRGFLALLLMFVICPCSDVFAYLVGSLIGGPKLCPKLSPKKTWSGAIGGVVGAIVGAIVVYFIFKPNYFAIDGIWVMVICGLFGGILTEIGDLFESFIKRKAGIKDMGKIMPGHGGVMDRIDGTLLASVFITIFLFLI